jgi:hypothetical protein
MSILSNFLRSRRAVERMKKAASLRRRCGLLCGKMQGEMGNDAKKGTAKGRPLTQVTPPVQLRNGRVSVPLRLNGR